MVMSSKLFTLCILCVTVFASITNARDVRVEIKADYKTKVSPDLYGLFFEDLNHASDGGLYAEMVQNRTFKEIVMPEDCSIENGLLKTKNGYNYRLKPQSNLHGWSEVAQDGGQVKLNIDDQSPLNKQNFNSLKIEVMNAQGRAGFANQGYWGMSVIENDRYNLSFYASSSTAVTLTASLESIDGSTIHAISKVKNVEGPWKQYKCTLLAKSSDPKARLVITVDNPARLRFNVVSLFPEKTYKNRANGMRIDIMEKLAALKPKFFRFPGGCFVEGCSLGSRYKWKETIGDIAQRPGHWNLWGYHSTDGLGFHEYLQMAEDLNSEVLYVVNCGMSCQARPPYETVRDTHTLVNVYVQDVLDALEYAMGSTSTKWGAIRAQNDHPKPFKIKYLEIGNENQGPNYHRVYPIFSAAIKAKYPDIIMIANTSVPGAPLDVIDEHRYADSNWFFANANHYQKYDRRGPRIYVGEYAVNTNVGEGNLLGALAEAAFMLGLERNSDLVIMASYSEMLQNANDREWGVNAIHFDSSRIFGRSSYYMQKLFAENSSTVMIDSQIFEPDLAVKEPNLNGMFGLRTFSTDSEFKDIRITKDNKVIYESDFSEGSDEWKVESGKWVVENGVYRQSDCNQNNTLAFLTNMNLSDCTIELKAKRNAGREGFMIVFHKNNERFVQWNLGGFNNTQHAIQVFGALEDMTVSKAGSIDQGRRYDVKIVLKGNHADCFLDGQLTQSAEIKNRPIPRFFANAGVDEKTDQLIIKIINPTAESVNTKLNLAGFNSVAPSATVITLSGEHALDENSFEKPTKISPVASEFNGAGSEFIYRIKPWSATVLRFNIVTKS